MKLTKEIEELNSKIKLLETEKKNMSQKNKDLTEEKEKIKKQKTNLEKRLLQNTQQINSNINVYIKEKLQKIKFQYINNELNNFLIYEKIVHDNQN